MCPWFDIIRMSGQNGVLPLQYYGKQFTLFWLRDAMFCALAFKPFETCFRVFGFATVLVVPLLERFFCFDYSVKSLKMSVAL